MSFGLAHVELIVDGVINLVEGFEQFKKLIKVDFLLSLADFAKGLIDGFLIEHSVGFRLVGLDVSRVQYTCAIGKGHKLAQRHGISLMRYLIKGGIRPAGIELLLTVEIEHNPRLLFKYLIVFFLQLSVDWC